MVQVQAVQTGAQGERDSLLGVLHGAVGGRFGSQNDWGYVTGNRGEEGLEHGFLQANGDRLSTDSQGKGGYIRTDRSAVWQAKERQTGGLWIEAQIGRGGDACLPGGKFKGDLKRGRFL